MKDPNIKSSKPSLKLVLANQRGLSTVEYVILLAVIVVGAVSVWTSLGENFKSSLSNAESELRSLNK